MALDEIRTKDLPRTATEDDLVSGTYFLIDGTDTPKLPAELVTKKSDLQRIIAKQKNTNFFVQNLLDKNASGVEADKILNIYSGNTESGAGVTTSDYFEVVELQDYFCPANIRCRCFYDKNKQFISGTGVSSFSGCWTFTAPVGAVYCRVSISTSNDYPSWADVALSPNRMPSTINPMSEDAKIPEDELDLQNVLKFEMGIPWYLLDGFSGGNAKKFASVIFGKSVAEKTMGDYTFVKLAAGDFNTLVLKIPEGYVGKISFTSCRFSVLAGEDGKILSDYYSSSNTQLTATGVEKYAFLSYANSVDLDSVVITFGNEATSTISLPDWLGVDSLKSAVSAEQEKSSNLSSSICDEFSASVSYTAGTFVMKDGVLYVFTSDHSAGAWVGTDAKEITSIRAILNFIAQTKNSKFFVQNLLVKNSSGVESDKILSISNGNTGSASGITTSDFFEVVPGQVYYCPANIRTYCFYDSSKSYIAGSGVNSYSGCWTFTAPVGAVYCRVSISTSNDYPSWADVALSPNRMPSTIDTMSNDAKIPSDCVDFSAAVKFEMGIPWYLLDGFSGGNAKKFARVISGKYVSEKTMGNDTFARFSSGSFNTFVLKIPENYVGKITFTSCRFSVLTDAVGKMLSSYSSYNAQLETTGAEKFVIISYASSVDLDSVVITFGNEATSTISLPDWLGINSLVSAVSAINSQLSEIDVDDNPKSLSVVSAAPSIGDTMTIDDALCEAKKVQVLNFSCTLNGTFVNMVVGWANSEGVVKYAIKITPDSLIPIKSGAEGTGSTSNLTIANNLQVRIVNKVSYIGFTITSDGETIENTSFPNFVNSPEGHLKPFVVVNSPVVNCKLSWTLQHMDAKILVMGDSYCGMNNPERWATLLGTDENDTRTVVNAYGGEASSNAIASLTNLLKTMHPKYIVWCLGMNDGSDSSSAPSSNWTTGRDAFLALCEQCGAEPVFGTIPTVPSINNEKKNEWIRASGKRYIDFANAVGANSSGVWYSGMLSTDEVHPTEKGAKALYAQALTDFPEFLIT